MHDEAHNIIVDYMDKKTNLVFMIYHMTDGEKQFFDKRLNFFVRWWLFPQWAKKEGINVW